MTITIITTELDPDRAKALGFIRPVQEQPARFLVEASYEGESLPPQLVSQNELIGLLRTNYERLANYGDGYEIEVWRYEGQGKTTPVLVVPVEPGHQEEDQVAQDYLLLAGATSEQVGAFTVVTEEA